MPKYSIIIPVYNRPEEVDELLRSLIAQEFNDFEVLIIDDGSDIKCTETVNKYEDRLSIRYFFKENSGPGDTRNYGFSKARADFMIIFDSDCILPPDYFTQLEKYRHEHDFDTYGGPDRAHPSFSAFQKAISHTLTSFFTTGGIRGRKKALEKFNPRSFNMGMKRGVYEQTGGFPDVLLAEDTDLSIRMHKMGLKVVLIPQCYVYHKRRLNFLKFFRQTHNFGYGRMILTKNHPESFKPFFLLPASFTIYLLTAIVLDTLYSRFMFLWPVVVYLAVIFTEALIRKRNLTIAILTVPSALAQLTGYGYGTLKGFYHLFILGKSGYPTKNDNPLKKAL